MLATMNTTRQTPKQQQLHESTAGEEDPGSGLDSAESAIKPDGVAPSAAGQPAPQPRPAHPEPQK